MRKEARAWVREDASIKKAPTGIPGLEEITDVLVWNSGRLGNRPISSRRHCRG